ncbi:MAG TPA: hypothetical protein VM099_04905 [Gemmatimonadaceae bacterium]|nr:hypothetical protein [Gemmatimonadaceae bacterium]
MKVEKASLRVLAALFVASSLGAQSIDSAQFRGLRYRMVGPSRGGRVTTVTGVPQEPMTFYMGASGGGVWKTTNAGISWTNISDGYFATGSIGSIDVSDSDPNIIYVGTGSEGLRSNVSIGRGIYKSSDAGKTWTVLGLRDAGQIGSVVIHPTNPAIVYAAAVGNPFKPNPDRGVYRTRDGGRTWQKVLFISDSTGAVDIELQPGHPDVVYAAMWRAERKPWTIISGANEGGVYKSSNGGDTWSRVTNGLPNALVGKADFAVSPSKPDRLYVLIEAKPGGGLYRSDDAGRSFTAVDTTTKGLITRPFYYTNIDADPNNADIVYVGTENYYKSVDGGRTWSTINTPHGDNHDLWINPRNSSIMIQSNDGGANVSLDGGRSWSTQNNQPTAEIYQVYVDNQVPYRLYGAQQDNNNELIIPSLPLGSKSLDDPIQNWTPGPGCETGPVMPHPANPDTVYGGCKGLFSRMSLRTGQERQYWIGAQSLYGNPGKDLIYRFQRVAPIEVSLLDPRTVYAGSQYLHRTRDEGVTWEKISQDLTWNPANRQQRVSGEPITIDVTGEEVYSTLYAIRESPLKKGVIWTGSNDGPFHVTRDGGATWKDVTPAGQPKGCRVQNIEPSPRRVASAYYAVVCYLLGDFRPFLWRSDNYGASWTLLTNGSNGIPADQPTRVVREDPEREGLLYAGTEFGAYVSFDNGARWQSLQLNLPVTPVTDMKVWRGDLVLSTQGRSFWILDDIAPLRELNDRMRSRTTHLFKPRDTYRLRYSSRFGGEESTRGSTADPQYPPRGAMIDYWLGANTTGPVTIDILNSSGEIVRTFSSERAPQERTSWPDLTAPTMALTGTPPMSKTPGMNRAIWDLAYPGPWDTLSRRSGRDGPMVAPGTFTVRLTANGVEESRPLVVRADPRALRDGMTNEILREQLAHNLRVRDLTTKVNIAVAQLNAMAKNRGDAALLGRLHAMQQLLITPPIRYSEPALQAHIQYLYSAALSADQKVGRDAQLRYAELKRQLDSALAQLRELIRTQNARSN